MYQKKKKNLLPLVVIVIISLGLAIVGVVVLPIPKEYKQLVFWGVLALVSIGAGAIVKYRGKRRM